MLKIVNKSQAMQANRMLARLPKSSYENSSMERGGTEAWSTYLVNPWPHLVYLCLLTEGAAEASHLVDMEAIEFALESATKSNRRSEQ